MAKEIPRKGDGRGGCEKAWEVSKSHKYTQTLEEKKAQGCPDQVRRCYRRTKKQNAINSKTAYSKPCGLEREGQ